MEMENFFSRLTLDIIGRAVFNYDFDSLTHDDPVIQVCNTSLVKYLVLLFLESMLRPNV